MKDDFQVGDIVKHRNRNLYKVTRTTKLFVYIEGITSRISKKDFTLATNSEVAKYEQSHQS